MDNHPHIGLVDTHSKSICRYHHTGLVVLPGYLALIFCGSVEPRMIEGGRDACLVEQFGKLLGAAAATGVDDGCSLDILEDMNELLALICGLTNDISKVPPLEAHAEDIKWNMTILIPHSTFHIPR